MSRRALLISGLSIFVSLAILGHHKWGTVDAIQRFAVTRSIVERGSVVTPEFGPVKYAPLQPALMIPTYLAGYAAGLVLPGDSEPRQLGYRVTAFLFTPLVVVALALVHLRLALRLGAYPRTAAFATFLLVFATLLLPYSRILFSEPLNALLLLLAVEGVLVPGRAALGPACLLALNNAVFLPVPLLIAALLRHREAVPPVRLAGPIAALLATWGLYNHLRYGSPLRFGYADEPFSTPLLTGLTGLLLSIGRGLVVYSPLTAAAAVYTIVVAVRSRRLLPILAGGLFAGYLLLYATWGSYEGGWCWGPRFLLPFVPLLHLVLTAHPPGKAWRPLLLAAAALGFGVNAWEYLGVYQDWERATFDGTGVDYRLSIFHSEYAAILHNWDASAALRLWPQLLLAAAVAFLGLRASVRPRGSPLEDGTDAPAEASAR